MSKIFKCYGHRPKISSTKIEGRSVVDKAGYIPFNEQIRNMRAAGTRLEEYRRAMYTNEIEGEMMDDFRINPMGYKDFDEFMAHDLSRSLTVRKIMAEKAAKEREAMEARESSKDGLKEQEAPDKAKKEDVPKGAVDT